MQENIIEEIKNDKLIRKYMYKYIWVSGSSTKVFPIMIYKGNDDTIKEITIQINTKRNYFKKLLERYKSKYKEIDYAYFGKNDDSCPSVLVFKMKGW